MADIKAGHDGRALDFPKTPESAISPAFPCRKQKRLLSFSYGRNSAARAHRTIGDDWRKKEKTKKRAPVWRACAQPEREFEDGEKFSSFFGRNPLKSPNSEN